MPLCTPIILEMQQASLAITYLKCILDLSDGAGAAGGLGGEGERWTARLAGSLRRDGRRHAAHREKRMTLDEALEALNITIARAEKAEAQRDELVGEIERLFASYGTKAGAREHGAVWMIAATHRTGGK